MAPCMSGWGDFSHRFRTSIADNPWRAARLSLPLPSAFDTTVRLRSDVGPVPTWRVTKMRRKGSRAKASARQPLQLRAEANRSRRTWVWAGNRRDLRRYRRWRPKSDEEWPRDRWELILRTMIEQVGLDQLCEIIESVVIGMPQDEIVAAQTSHPR